MIAILDYGMGNLHSVENALQHIGCTCCVTDKKEDLQRADCLLYTSLYRKEPGI